MREEERVHRGQREEEKYTSEEHKGKSGNRSKETVRKKRLKRRYKRRGEK